MGGCRRFIARERQLNGPSANGRFDEAALLNNIWRVASNSSATWFRWTAAFFREPYPWLADGLAGSGARQGLALLTVPLWLTPDLYEAHLRNGGSRSGRSAMWAAAGLWLGTMTLMGLPFTTLLQAPLAQLGRALGYWDDQFASPLIAAFLTATLLLLLVLIASLEWALIWAACGIDAVIGSRTISPPRFGYVAIKSAGAMAGVAVLTSGLLFSVRPLNDPVWHWIGRAGFLQASLVASVAAALLFGYNRKSRIYVSCGEQIYGSRTKAIVYQLAGPIVMLATLWTLVRIA